MPAMWPLEKEELFASWEANTKQIKALLSRFVLAQYLKALLCYSPIFFSLAVVNKVIDEQRKTKQKSEL